MPKFYEIKNQTEEGSDLYVYGSIVNGKDEIWGNPTDVDFTDFRAAIDAMKENAKLNMYINSGGGSCFAASSMVSIMQRAKETKNIQINAYIDGLCASAATWLAMAADNLYVYDNSMMMIHKPMSVAVGNADDFRREIDTLDKLQNDVMLPLYERKAKCNDAELQSMINAETWLSAKEIDDKFNVIMLNETKDAVASVDMSILNRYKHTPECLLKDKMAKPVDYSAYESRLANIKIREEN